MTTLVLDKEPVAVAVSLSSQHLTIELADGRRVMVPLDWYPRLMDASRAERRNWRLLGDGYAIEWPDLDEHIGVEGLLAGHASGESPRSLNRWLASRTRQSGKKNASSHRKQPKKKAAKS
jgi:Protein of unknown function (DUF2442)